MASPSDAHVYARQLLLKRHGYPLWVPEPYGHSVTYRTKGVRIGDVGFVTPEGAFDTLFNIRASPLDPINFRGVPDYFEQLDLPSHDLVHLPSFHRPASAITSAAAKKQSLDFDLTSEITVPVSLGASAKFCWASSEGAILHLPEGASRTSSPAELFRGAAMRGAKYWYQFANTTLSRGVPNGSLYLITGCDKTSSWMVGSFCQSSSDNQAALNVSATCLGGIEGGFSYSWETYSPAVYRIGPPSPIDQPSALSLHQDLIQRDNDLFEADAPSGQSQTVFIRGFRLMLRTFPWSSVLGNSPKVDVRSLADSNAKDILRGSRNIPFLGGNGQSSRSQTSSESSQRPGSSGSMWSLSELGDEDDVNLEAFPYQEQMPDLSNCLNRYILNMTPAADVAIIHDDEWISLLHETDVDIPSDDELVSRFLSSPLNIGSIDRSASLIPEERGGDESVHQMHYTTKLHRYHVRTPSIAEDQKEADDEFESPFAFNISEPSHNYASPRTDEVGITTRPRKSRDGRPSSQRDGADLFRSRPRGRLSFAQPTRRRPDTTPTDTPHARWWGHIGELPVLQRRKSVDGRLC